MKITIEKSESGYSVSTGESGSGGLTAEQAMVRAVNLIAQISTTPKEPEIPACLHCGSKDAEFSWNRSYGEYVRIFCNESNGGCGSMSGLRKIESEAIALWKGVKK